jgi:hypothetical protein
MGDGDARRRLIKVYQVLENKPSTSDRLSEGHCSVLTLEHLLLYNRMVNLKKIMEQTRVQNLLMTSCENIQMLNYESKRILESFFANMN